MFRLLTCTLSWCPQVMLLSPGLAPCTHSPQRWTSSFGDGRGSVQPWLTSVTKRKCIESKIIQSWWMSLRAQHRWPANLKNSVSSSQRFCLPKERPSLCTVCTVTRQKCTQCCRAKWCIRTHALSLNIFRRPKTSINTWWKFNYLE